MKEGSYQFIHVDAYAREGSSRTTTEIKKNGDKIITTKKSAWCKRNSRRTSTN
jgi:hypothetical protein